MKARRAEYQRQYLQRPEVKAKKAEVQRRYRQSPEGKASRMREYRREREDRLAPKEAYLDHLLDLLDRGGLGMVTEALSMGGLGDFREMLDGE